MINYRLATKEDLPQIIAFYKEACDHQQYDQYGPDWTWGYTHAKSHLNRA